MVVTLDLRMAARMAVRKVGLMVELTVGTKEALMGVMTV